MYSDKGTQGEKSEKKCGKTIPQLGTQQKELEPLRVPGLPVLHPADVQHQADLQAVIFLSETGLTLEEATGHVEAKIPVARTITPFQHGKPFVTEEEEKSLGTQMFNLHRWYLRMSNDQGKIFGVKYRDHDFFRGERTSGCTSKIYTTFTIDKPSTPLSSPFGFCKYHLPLHCMCAL